MITIEHIQIVKDKRQLGSEADEIDDGYQLPQGLVMARYIIMQDFTHASIKAIYVEYQRQKIFTRKNL